MIFGCIQQTFVGTSVHKSSGHHLQRARWLARVQEFREIRSIRRKSVDKMISSACKRIDSLGSRVKPRPNFFVKSRASRSKTSSPYSARASPCLHIFHNAAADFPIGGGEDGVDGTGGLSARLLQQRRDAARPCGVIRPSRALTRAGDGGMLSLSRTGFQGIKFSNCEPNRVRLYVNRFNNRDCSFQRKNLLSGFSALLDFIIGGNKD